MKIRKILALGLLSILAVSCGTTSGNSNPSTTSVQAPSQKDSDFISSLSDVKFSVLQTPKAADYGKSFASSFIVQVKNSAGSVMADYPVTIEYPVGNQNEKVEFATVSTTTDAAGKVLFKPENTEFAVNSEILFYPTPASNKKSTVQAAKNAGTSTKFQIKSKIISKGAILFIWEFNEKDKPVTNCYTVLSELQTRGATAGNAPVNQESYIGASTETLYKKNHDIVENNFGFLIGGTVKYESPVAKDSDNMWTCNLVSEIYVIDMATGKEVFRKTYKASEKDAKYDKAISNCKKTIAKIIVDNLVDNL